jgi:hypothetical protein
MPDASAYQYLTATLDLARADHHNLLVSNDQGQLITTARLRHPGGQPPSARSARVSIAAPRPTRSAPRRTRAYHLTTRQRCAGANKTSPPSTIRRRL